MYENNLKVSNKNEQRRKIEKINAELEKLNDEELEKIAGGTCEEVDEDVNRFKKLNITIFGEELLGTTSKDYFYAALTMEFKKHGVKYVHSFSNPNQYYIDGKKVTQAEAWKHIEAQHKK